ncbi:hypothetical protein ASPWEDRAFT_37820 [Aspergillus wentii DTO 134E9]|uniref:Uncharacterized protein n=1 Tax=Aspergillus wentii DTO 134E9 TaxID=1073089 RepID=A0A1L9RY99_ASPWE|nr:uncharacterized protein ASPWEDRAFT_37820 [Aspergillus wentii DTO 134E9]OJJ39946.1 hypothetical protein ASPWEDRAFT_37820 [Aspergillus wentii DTO 134E9]
MWRCHQKYGPVVRYGPNHVMFQSSSAAKDIYPIGRNFSKDPILDSAGKEFHNTFTFVDKKDHAQRRRLVGAAFTAGAIQAFAPKIQHYTGLFLEAIRPTPNASGWGAPINVGDWCSYLALDLALFLTFGIDFGAIEGSEYRHVVHDVTTANMKSIVLLHMPYLALGRLDKLLIPGPTAAGRRNINTIRKAIKKREGAITSGQDIYALMTSEKARQGSNIGRKQIEAECILMSSAGLDSTASAMSATIFYLTRYPHAYAKLAGEVRSMFPSVEHISLEGIRQCRYLHACIIESCRISPPAGSAQWRVAGKGGAVVDGVEVPEGYGCGVAMYATLHNEEYYPRPYEFIPERWLVDGGTLMSSASQVAAAEQAFVPFGTGSRACIGRPLAEMEIMMCVASLICKYDFQAAAGPAGKVGAGSPFAVQGRTNPLEFQVIDRMTPHREGPMIQLRERV